MVDDSGAKYCLAGPKERITYPPRRAGFWEVDYGEIGNDASASIDRGVRNAKVGQMIAQYLQEFCEWKHSSLFESHGLRATATWALKSLWIYLCNECTSLPIKDVEIILASIIWSGATRQAVSGSDAIWKFATITR